MAVAEMRPAGVMEPWMRRSGLELAHVCSYGRLCQPPEAPFLAFPGCSQGRSVVVFLSTIPTSPVAGLPQPFGRNRGHRASHVSSAKADETD